MTTDCLGQNIGAEVVKMLIIIIFNLSGIRREFVLTCILNIMTTLAFYFFSQECSLLDVDIAVCDHTVSATIPRTSTKK